MAEHMPKVAVQAGDEVSPVVASIQTNMVDVDEILSARATRSVPEGERPNYLNDQKANIFYLEDSRNVVFEAATVYKGAMTEKNRSGRKLRTKTRKTTTVARENRTAFRSHYGEEILVELRFTDKPDQRRGEVLAQVKPFVRALGDLDPEQWKPLEGKEPLNIDARRVRLQNTANELDEARTDYALKVKVADDKRFDLQEVAIEHRRTFTSVTMNQESLFRMAGLDEQARKLRYLVQRAQSRRLRQPQSPEQPAETPQADTATPPANPSDT